MCSPSVYHLLVFLVAFDLFAHRVSKDDSLFCVSIDNKKVEYEPLEFDGMWSLSFALLFAAQLAVLMKCLLLFAHLQAYMRNPICFQARIFVHCDEHCVYSTCKLLRFSTGQIRNFFPDYGYDSPQIWSRQISGNLSSLRCSLACRHIMCLCAYFCHLTVSFLLVHIL